MGLGLEQFLSVDPRRTRVDCGVTSRRYRQTNSAQALRVRVRIRIRIRIRVRVGVRVGVRVRVRVRVQVRVIIN